jgi:hypothetical protein
MQPQITDESRFSELAHCGGDPFVPTEPEPDTEPLEGEHLSSQNQTDRPMHIHRPGEIRPANEVARERVRHSEKGLHDYLYDHSKAAGDTANRILSWTTYLLLFAPPDITGAVAKVDKISRPGYLTHGVAGLTMVLPRSPRKP